ncbi:MAG: hypothetical protein WBO39_12810 [Ferruginibacter sp.]
MKKSLLLMMASVCAIFSYAQVKIGNNPGTIDANSLLELESTNKGFLPPRVALNSISSVAPLTGTIPTGMLVFSTGGTLADGYYYWNGTGWVILAIGQVNLITKTANATLTKLETFVLASNNIMLTLPAITSADNGLSITVKNVGIHSDLVVVLGNSGAVIDYGNFVPLPRWFSQTFTAYGGNWVLKQRTAAPLNIMDVSVNSSWQTVQEAIEFLNLHMTGPAIIRLGSGSFNITETQTIDLPYTLTIQGSSFGASTIAAAPGLEGKPMFRCISDCYFKMLQFDATKLSGYGTATGEDAIRFVGSDTYNEIKDCNFDRFYNTILDSTNAELWIFETDIYNAQNHGILIHSAEDSVVVKVAETDFINCKTGIHMSKGSKAIIQLSSGGYYNASASDTAINYTASSFTSFRNISITGNTWNNTGKYIEGFDFTRTDGRDANAKVESNAGMGDQKPNCFINVINSSTTKTLTTINTWYKVDWGTNTSSETCKWTIASNKITYQPANSRNGIFIISGNLSVNNSNQNISITIVKNGNSAIKYGETTIRVTTLNQPFPFSFIAYLPNMLPGDYFEIYYSNPTNGGQVVKIQDIQWLVNTQ